MSYNKVVETCVGLFGQVSCNTEHQPISASFFVEGLYSGLVIGLDVEPNSLVATKLNKTQGTITGTEGITSRGSIYTEKTIKLGDKVYVEFGMDSMAFVANNFFWVGLEKAGSEQPFLDVGQSVDQLGYSKGGSRYIEGSFDVSGGVSYTNSDTIGLSIDYTGQTVTVGLYKNGLFIQTDEYTLGVGEKIRPSICLGIQTDIGSTASIHTAALNQTYPAPTGFSPFE